MSRTVTTAGTSEEIEQLIVQHTVLAERLARRFSNGPAPDPDLEQVAMIGLYLAASRFDAERGTFPAFAMVTIVGELKKHLRSNGWTAKVPRRMQEASITVATAIGRLEQRLQRSPTPEEVATETDLSLEQVLNALHARNARFSAGPPLCEHPATDQNLERLEAVIDLRRATRALPEEQRRLLDMHFAEELSQREIAERLGISQSQVHRRIAGIVAHLRRAMRELV